MRSHELHVAIDDAMEVFWGRKSMNDSVLPMFMAASKRKTGRPPDPLSLFKSETPFNALNSLSVKGFQ
jgi:hypothetical protein